jgi:hypothetical protein
MGTKNNPGTYDCYEKAEPDEPMFVLLARDPRAPLLVRMWAALELTGGDATTVDLKRFTDKVQEALECSKSMEEWRKANRDDME